MSALWQLEWKEAVEYDKHINLHDGFVEEKASRILHVCSVTNVIQYIKVTTIQIKVTTV